MANVYRGVRTRDGVQVTVNGFPLSPAKSINVRNHSPTGFEWGYGGSGPAQLALAILLNELGRIIAEQLYQDFKWRVVANLDRDWWELTGDDIRGHVDALQAAADAPRPA